MRRLLAFILPALFIASPALAQTQPCATKTASGNCVPGQVLIDPATGLPYKAAGGGGGGGGDASAANQTSQITQETLINTRLGDITSPAAGSVNARLATIATNTGQGRDSGGRLLPGQGIVTSTRTTLTASTATALEAAGVSARILEQITVTAALTADVYVCTTQTTSCSATAWDFLIPSGAPAGQVYFSPFGTQARIYAWSTGTPTLVLGSWAAQ